MTVSGTVAITGASGFLGQAVGRAATARGLAVRALSRRPHADGGGITWSTGDVADRAVVELLLTGADAVVHCGATLHGAEHAVFASIVDGTRVVAETAAAQGIRMIHLSSLAVVAPALGREGAILDDRAAVDPRPESRGAYTRAKVAAEALLDSVAFADLDLVVVRPGQLVGDGLAAIPPSLGLPLGPVRVGLVASKRPLAVVHVDDAAEAILALLRASKPPRQITLVDPSDVTRRELMAACRRHSIPGSEAPLIDLGWGLQPLARLGQAVPGPVGRMARRLRGMDVRAKWESPGARALGWRPERLATWLRPASGWMK